MINLICKELGKDFAFFKNIYEGDEITIKSVGIFAMNCIGVIAIIYVILVGLAGMF